MNELADILNRIAEAQICEFADCNPLQVNSRSILGDTPLHVVSVWGDAEAAATLLDAGADIDARGEHEYTALHEAVEQGHGSVVKLLIERGASRDAKNIYGLTPQGLAQATAQTEIVRLFE